MTILDLARVDVEAAGDDHVLLAIDDGDEAVRDRARPMSPTVTQPSTSASAVVLWVCVPVAVEGRRPAAEEFAQLVRHARAPSSSRSETSMLAKGTPTLPGFASRYSCGRMLVTMPPSVEP
jgi:hypothetical protein